MTDLLFNILWFFGDLLLQFLIDVVVRLLFPFGNNDDGGSCGCAVIFIALCLLVGGMLWFVFG